MNLNVLGEHVKTKLSCPPNKIGEIKQLLLYNASE